MANEGQKIRVAAAQLGVTDDVEQNLVACCRLLDEAAKVKPDLVVLPEFCNHVAWYKDREHSYEVAVDLNGRFLQTIAAKVAEHQFYLMINCTVRRPNNLVTGTNILFDKNGQQIANADKQVLMGNENNFLEKATESCPILELPFGRVGMYSCMDGVIFETSRGMAVRGAQMLLNSLNSFAKDEGSLHIPVRAAENKVFVVAANKVGALVPPDMLEIVAARLQIKPEQLHGAGHSQIVAPDGTVLAQAPAAGEAVVYADIDVGEAANKARPDETDVMATRRPTIYERFRAEPAERRKPAGAKEVNVAVFQPTERGETAVLELNNALIEAAASEAKLVCLPELFHLSQGRVDDVGVGVEQSRWMITAVSEALSAFAKPPLVTTTIVSRTQHGIQHTAVLIGADGVILSQPQLHASGRHPWVTALGDTVHTLELNWGRVALVTGNDAIYPETFRLIVLEEAEVVAVPTQILEQWEADLGLLERSAENRMNLVVGSGLNAASGGMILATDPDFTLWAPWQKRPFDGNINHPIVTRAPNKGGLTIAPVYPAATANRTISQKTNVVESRPWWLADTLLA
ncbi:MAG: carbon-nitrogen hydrolase family protein [Chloroflexota bacterium]